MTLRSSLIPLTAELKQLNVGIRLDAKLGTGPMLKGCLAHGESSSDVWVDYPPFACRRWPWAPWPSPSSSMG